MRIFCMSAMVMCSFSYNVVFLARGTRHCTARKFATPPCVSPFGHKENRRVYTLCPASKNKSWFPPGLSGRWPGVPRPCGDAFVFSAFLLSYHMEPLRSEALWGRTIGTLTFSAARLSDLLHRSYLLSQQSPASSRSALLAQTYCARLGAYS